MSRRRDAKRAHRVEQRPLIAYDTCCRQAEDGLRSRQELPHPSRNGPRAALLLLLLEPPKDCITFGEAPESVEHQVSNSTARIPAPFIPLVHQSVRRRGVLPAMGAAQDPAHPAGESCVTGLLENPNIRLRDSLVHDIRPSFRGDREHDSEAGSQPVCQAGADDVADTPDQWDRHDDRGLRRPVSHEAHTTGLSSGMVPESADLKRCPSKPCECQSRPYKGQCADSSSCVPSPTIRPLSSTRIRSTDLSVDSR